ncbi:MAG: 1-acyl-sn-glycerol-3-phosphate acyltransferase [Paludibacteraceae bacterium]|nr:1-acyl-sn-glycerol-3-phosphate acyltransferase [Paludibacteraceae bacterium]
MVVCLAPHTSNWDFVYGRLSYAALGINVSFLIKDDWLIGPVGWWLRKVGAIGINRTGHHSMTDQLAQKFAESKRLHLAIAPEGTRKRNPDWKMGFYYIAVKAGVPILLAGLDYKDKCVKILELFYPTGDAESDIKAIKRKFVGITARIPEKFDLGDL